MSDAFREMFEGLKETAEALIVANTALKKTADAALRAKDEHEDVRETVLRLESALMAQGAEFRAQLQAQHEELRLLRQRLNGQS